MEISNFECNVVNYTNTDMIIDWSSQLHTDVRLAVHTINNYLIYSFGS